MVHVTNECTCAIHKNIQDQGLVLWSYYESSYTSAVWQVMGKQHLGGIEKLRGFVGVADAIWYTINHLLRKWKDSKDF